MVSFEVDSNCKEFNSKVPFVMIGFEKVEVDTLGI
jgi:hypothetical protein